MQPLAPIASEPTPRPVVRAELTPAVAVERRAAEQALRVEPGEATERTANDRAANDRTRPDTPAPAPARSSRARLSYEQLNKQVYVEIVDPSVVKRGKLTPYRG